MPNSLPQPAPRAMIRRPEEIERMRTAGRLAAEVLGMIERHVRPGIRTGELDRLCHEYIVQEQHAIPAPLNYKGFPKSICTSVNHVVCHGIPGDRTLRDGDILNIDVTVLKDDYHGDTSKMFLIGKTPLRARRLVEVAYECMLRGIEAARAGNSLRAVGAAIQKHADANRFSVVRDFCGHGIGRNFHEAPSVLHYRNQGPHLILEPGMTFTIEPMLNAGRYEVKLLADGWTAVTRDHSLSAQWEHTILITADHPEILTQRKEECVPHASGGTRD